MSKEEIWKRIEDVEAQLDMIEKTWGVNTWSAEAPATVHEYVSSLFKERNVLISLYREAVKA